MAGKNKSELVKFIEEEISQTETALAFVIAELDSGKSTQYNYVYSRKKFEYEGMLSAYTAVLDAANGVEPEVADAVSV